MDALRPYFVCADVIKGELECSICGFTAYNRSLVLSHVGSKHGVSITGPSKSDGKLSLEKWIEGCRLPGVTNPKVPGGPVRPVHREARSVSKKDKKSAADVHRTETACTSKALAPVSLSPRNESSATEHSSTDNCKQPVDVIQGPVDGNTSTMTATEKPNQEAPTTEASLRAQTVDKSRKRKLSSCQAKSVRSRASPVDNIIKEPRLHFWTFVSDPIQLPAVFCRDPVFQEWTCNSCFYTSFQKSAVEQHVRTRHPAKNYEALAAQNIPRASTNCPPS